jgi:hypothetical protein
LNIAVQPEEIVPETKDWTWVLSRTCPECGLTAGALEVSALPGLVKDSALRLSDALRHTPDVRRRPAPTVWSVLEYACHVRDVHRVFAGRLALMLAEDAPVFANWDQDDAAVQGRYAEQDPVDVDLELLEAAAEAAARYAGVTPEQELRRGLRSNGSEFTVRTLGQYHLHDVLHHLHDIGWAAPSPESGP